MIAKPQETIEEKVQRFIDCWYLKDRYTDQAFPTFKKDLELLAAGKWEEGGTIPQATKKEDHAIALINVG